MISADTLQSDLAKAEAYGNAFKAGLSLLPSMMAAAEQLLPAKGTGTQKLAIVENGVKGFLTWAGHAEEVVVSIWAQFEPIIATLVSLYTGNPAIAQLLGMTVFTPKVASNAAGAPAAA